MDFFRVGGGGGIGGCGAGVYPCILVVRETLTNKSPENFTFSQTRSSLAYVHTLRSLLSSGILIGWHPRFARYICTTTTPGTYSRLASLAPPIGAVLPATALVHNEGSATQVHARRAGLTQIAGRTKNAHELKKASASQADITEEPALGQQSDGLSRYRPNPASRYM